jgi:hypothetical protein
MTDKVLYPERVLYLEELDLLSDSNALLVVGSVEPDYTTSKIFPCIQLRIFTDGSSRTEQQTGHRGTLRTQGRGQSYGTGISSNVARERF